MRTVAGTGTLLRVALRRDRIRIAVWVLAIGLGTYAVALALEGVYPTEADRRAAMVTMSTPAGLAFSGPAHFFTDYHLGSILGHQMLGFMAVIVGLMSVLFVVRHTRTEEETGRAELARANAVGRYAHLASALLLATLVNLAIAVLMALTLPLTGLEGVTWAGSALYGTAHAAVGVTFAGLAAVTAQVTQSSRGANGLGMAGVGVAYLIRALGDATGSRLSWASPIGWAQRTFPYLDDVWWPLALNLLALLALSALAMALSARRDLGAGLRAPRAGRATATRALRRPLGFAVRLQRGMFVGFAVGMSLLGLSYGPFLGDLESQFVEIQLIQDAISSIGGATFLDSFISMLMTITATVAAIYVVLAVLRARSEETSGRNEAVLGTWQSRSTFLGSHLAVALVGGPVVLFLCGLLLGLAGQPTVEEPIIAMSALAALVRAPALWVFAGLAAVLVGWAPRATFLAWVGVAYAVVVSYLGPLLQLPDWLARLSPFGWLPDYPAEEVSLLPLLGLTVVAAVLIGLGLVGFRRRDLETG